jgi:hypothetical protein
MSSSETPSALHLQGHDVSWRMEGNEVLSQTDLRSSPYGKTQNANGLVTADTRGIFAQYGSGLRGAHEGLMQSGLGPQVAHDGPEPGLYANKSYSSLPPSIFGAKPAAGAGGGKTKPGEVLEIVVRLQADYDIMVPKLKGLQVSLMNRLAAAIAEAGIVLCVCDCMHAQGVREGVCSYQCGTRMRLHYCMR